MSSLVNNNPYNVVTKSDFQIYDYLKNYWYDDLDWKSIILFCNLRRKNRPIERNKAWKGQKGTFTDFFQWYYRGFGFGDIVRYGEKYAVVDHFNTYSCYLQLSYSNYLGYRCCHEIAKREELRHLTKEETEIAKAEFLKQDYRIDEYGLVFTCPQYVKVGAFVEIKEDQGVFLGKVSAINYNTIDISYMFFDGELMPCFRSYSYYEIRLPRKYKIFKVYHYCKKNLLYDIKRDIEINHYDLNDSSLPVDDE